MQKPIIKPFDVNDLERIVTDESRLIMVETILAWADLDTGISRLIYLVFGLENDAGSILIANMDLKTKAEKIKTFYVHRGNDTSAASLGRMITKMGNLSKCRNAIAHRKVIGRMESEPTRLVFMSSKHIKRHPDSFEMLCFDHSEMIASATFAREAARKIEIVIASLEAG